MGPIRFFCPGPIVCLSRPCIYYTMYIVHYSRTYIIVYYYYYYILFKLFLIWLFLIHCAVHTVRYIYTFPEISPRTSHTGRWTTLSHWGYVTTTHVFYSLPSMFTIYLGIEYVFKNMSHNQRPTLDVLVSTYVVRHTCRSKR